MRRSASRPAARRLEKRDSPHRAGRLRGESPGFVACRLPLRYHLGIPSLGRESTPAEIRIGRESCPSWVAEAGISAFFIRFKRPIRRLACGFVRNGLATGKSAQRPNLCSSS